MCSNFIWWPVLVSLFGICFALFGACSVFEALWIGDDYEQKKAYRAYLDDEKTKREYEIVKAEVRELKQGLLFLFYFMLGAFVFVGLILFILWLVF